MLTGTPLDLTPFGCLLTGIGLLYWLLAIGALVYAVKKPKARRDKALAAGAVLLVIGYLPGKAVWSRYQAKRRLDKAIALFETQCKTAGENWRWMAVVLMASLLGGCGDPHMEWNEQVKLQSGEVIVVARTAKFSENWVAGGGGGSFNKGMTLKIVQPAMSDSPGPWDARFVPIVLDRDPETHEWFIVATFFHCDSWYELGRPKLPYTEYRFRNTKWIQQPLSQKWIGREANMLPVDLSRRGTIAESKPLLTVERKEGIFYGSAMSPEFKRVVDKWPSAAGC